MLDLTGTLLVVLDRDGRIVDFNGACQRTTGYTAAQVRGKRLWDVLILPEDRAAVQAVFEQLRMGLYPNSFENYWRTKGGGRRYIAWVNTAILDENQDVEYIVGSGIDITERKQAEDREREYAGYLAILSEAAMSLVRSSTRDNIYRLLNEGLSKLLPQALYVSIGEYDASTRALTIKEVASEPDVLRLVEEQLGAKLRGMSLKIGTNDDLPKIMSGRLNRLSGGIHQATFGSVTKKVCRQVEKALGSPLVYGIGMSSGQTIYGTAVVLLPKGAEIGSQVHIETFVNQASVALLRLEAEQRVQERERYFRAITENAADIITIIDPDGSIRYKSPAVRAELGYRPEELVGQNIFGYIHPGDMAKSQEAFRTAVENPGVPLKMEFRFRHRDGSWRILDTTGINLISDPAVRGIVVNSRDISERVRDRERIRESEERYRSLVELSPDGCAIHQDGKVVFINASGARLLGASGPDQLVGKSFMDLAHPDHRETIRKRAAKVASDGRQLEPVEEKFLRLDGTEFDVEVAAGPITFGGLPAVHVMFRDITQRRKSLAALQESELRYRTTLDSMGDLVHLIDRDRRIIYVNPAFLGYMEALELDTGIVGKTYNEAFPFLPAKVGEEYERVLATGQALVTEETTVFGDREIFTETRKIPVEVEGRIERVVTIIRDITERKKAEADIREGRERFQHLADRITEGISIFEKGHLVYTNDRALEIFGYPREEFQGMSLADLTAPEERGKLAKLMDESMVKGMPPEQAVLWIVRKDGTRRCVYNRCYYTRKGKESLGYFMVTSDVTEKRLNELALIESEKQYRELFESNPNPMWVYDPQTLAFIAVNESAVRLYGYSRQEFSGMTLKDIRPLEDLPVLLESVSRSVRQKFDRTSLVRHRTKDGRMLSVEVLGHSVKFSGRDARLVMINDVTERQRIEEAVRDSEEKFRALAEQSPNMIFINQGGRVVYANPVCTAAMGYSLEEFYDPDFDFMVLIAPEDRERIGRLYRRHQQGEEVESYEYTLVTKDGRSLEAILTTKLVDLKSGPAIMGIVTDMTNLRRAERELTESQLRLSRLVQNMAEGVYRTSEDGRFLDANPAMARIFGYGSVEELMGADIKSELYFDPEDRMANYPLPGEERVRELRMRRRDGTEVWVEDNCRYIRGHNGQVSVHEGVLRDVTERRKAEEALRDSEERYRNFFEDDLTGDYLSTPEGGLVDCNPAFAQMMGFGSVEEVLRSDTRELYFLPEGRQEFLDRLQAEGRLDSAEVELRRRDGSPITVIENVVGNFDPEGRLTSFKGYMFDITKRKRAEEAVRQHREQLQRITDNMVDIITMLDAEGKRVFVTPSVERIAGYKPEELLGKMILEQVHPDDRTQIEGLHRDFHQRKGELQKAVFRYRHKQGHYIWVESSANPIIDQEGRVTGSVIASRDVSARVQAESMQRESEERYRTLVQSMNDGLLHVDNDDVIHFVNERFCRMVGYSSQELLGQVGHRLLLFPEDWEQAKSRNSERTTGATGQYEVRMRRRDGRAIWTSVSASPVRDDQGGVTGSIGIVADITDSKLAADMLRESEERYRLLADKMPDALFIYDDDRFTYANRAGQALLGVGSFEELAGRSKYDFVHPDYRDFVRQRTGLIRQNGREVPLMEQKVLRADGTEVDINVKSIPFPHQGRNLVMSIVRDITEMKKAEQALAASEEKYRNLAEASPDIIFIVDRKGTVKYLNSAGARTAGRKPEEAVGAPLAAFFPPEVYRRQWANLSRVMENGQSLYVEAETPLGGKTRFLDSWLVPLRSQDGAVDAVIGISRDTTERKRMEQELLESERKYRHIFEGVAEGIYRSTPEGKPLMANPALVRMLGYESLEENLARDIEKEGYFDPAVREAYKRAMEEKGEVRDFVNVWRRKDGSELVVRENAHAVRDEQGAILYYEGTIEDITAQERAQQALKENERRLATLMNNLPGMAYRCRNDRQWTMEFVSQGCLDLTEYGPEEIIGNRGLAFADLIVPDDREMVWDEVQDAVTKGSPFQLLYRIVTKGGRLKWVWEQGVAVQSPEGNAQTLEGFMIDISPRMLAEEALYNSEHQYRTTIDAMGDPIHVVDRDLMIVLVNEAFKRSNLALGFVPEGVGKSVFDVYPFLDRGKVGEEYRRVFDDGMVLMTEERHLINGRERITETRKIPVYEGSRVVRSVTVVRDITERKAAEEALRESEEKYRQVFDGIAEGIYRTTPEGRIEMANPALLKILGYDSLEELRQVDLNQTGYADSGERARFMELMGKDGQVRDFEAIWRRKDGRLVMLNENARAVKAADGLVLFYEGTVEDVTLRKQAEQAVREEKNKLADLFQVSLTVAGTRNVPDKIRLTLEGIKHTNIFRRAALVIRNPDGSMKHFDQFGLEEGDAERARATVVKASRMWERIREHERRISNSYLFKVHRGTELEPGAIRIPSRQTSDPDSDWNPDDSLIIPLRIGGRKAGYISLDEPKRGLMPSLEEIRLLELFANQLSVSLENINLYDDLERSYYSTLKAFVAAMEAKDPYTKGHSENVRHYALKIANSMDLPQERIILIDYSALLHDIGKLGIREEILTKPDLLSLEEYQEVKLHPEIGSRMVSDIEMLDRTAHIIRSHHEYYDGQGYPMGLSGEEIPLESRIISVADAFEAMTSDRPYRKAFGKEVAIERLKESAGRQFDARIVEIFSDIVNGGEQ